jgi:solute carrier family 25 folate transporter 32
LVKTRLAVQRDGSAGIIGTIRVLLAQEGVRGLYRGLGPTLVALIPNWAVYFVSYNQLKSECAARGLGDGPVTHVLSSMGAAVVTDIATNPLWLAKTRMQTEQLGGGRRRVRGTFATLWRVWKHEGPLALWNGLTPQLFGVVHVMIQFPLYEQLKRRLGARRGVSAEELSTGELIAASALSKAVASTSAYPHEVLRSRLMAQRLSDPQEMRYKGVLDMIRRIAREEGLRGYYRGLLPNLLRTVPNAAITFTTYELIQRFLLRSTAFSAASVVSSVSLPPPPPPPVLTASGTSAAAAATPAADFSPQPHPSTTLPASHASASSS